ncbi:fructose-6-phosphate aldolase [Bacteriovoracaceae bacterium]|nr:fructose-6-phosphate aldolase [Bacteriovoracaceae bacterium]
MKFFIDTADIEEITQAQSLGLVDGVTTNPSLMAQTGRDPIAVTKEICKLVTGPVSAEVISTDFEGMYSEAQALAEIGPNIVVKLPLTIDGLKTCQKLSNQGIKTNVTLCFSANQALLAAKSGATYISPFVGRLDDIGQTGMDLIEEIKVVYQNYSLPTEILVASIRHPIHLKEAAMIGADVATIPYSVMTKLISHPLTTIGLEKFLADHAKSSK